MAPEKEAGPAAFGADARARSQLPKLTLPRATAVLAPFGRSMDDPDFVLAGVIGNGVVPADASYPEACMRERIHIDPD
jgi:hypothetical protein